MREAQHGFRAALALVRVFPAGGAHKNVLRHLQRKIFQASEQVALRQVVFGHVLMH